MRRTREERVAPGGAFVHLALDDLLAGDGEARLDQVGGLGLDDDIVCTTGGPVGLDSEEPPVHLLHGLDDDRAGQGEEQVLVALRENDLVVGVAVGLDQACSSREGVVALVEVTDGSVVGVAPVVDDRDVAQATPAVEDASGLIGRLAGERVRAHALRHRLAVDVEAADAVG